MCVIPETEGDKVASREATPGSREKKPKTKIKIKMNGVSFFNGAADDNVRLPGIEPPLKNKNYK